VSPTPARLTLVICALALGCGSVQAAPSSTQTPRAVAEPASSNAGAPSAAVPAPLSSALVQAARIEPLAKLDLEIVRVLTAPVSSIALGEGTRVAVLADTPQVGDAHGFKALPLPPGLRAKPSEVDQAQIFFGRDDEPRILGTRRSDRVESAIYWRHTASGWRDGREEIGQLGGTVHGGLWGVLGGDDPELVCRTNSLCIIKRSSGWKTAAAGGSTRQVSLQDGVLWGLDASGIAGIDVHGWALAIAAPAWSAPNAFWATRGEAWVGSERELFRFNAGTWTTLPLPIESVTAWWGAHSDSVWLVGKGGVAHFDGQRFRVAAVEGTLRAIRGRPNGEVWFGGDAGLFRARWREP
jgi:hypothetical protein